MIPDVWISTAVRNLVLFLARERERALREGAAFAEVRTPTLGADRDREYLEAIRLELAEAIAGRQGPVAARAGVFFKPMSSFAVSLEDDSSPEWPGVFLRLRWEAAHA